MDDISLFMKEDIAIMTIFNLQEIADKRISSQASAEFLASFLNIFAVICLKEVIQWQNSFTIHFFFQTAECDTILYHLHQSDITS